MKLKTKVSVCMITYGHEKFIEQAINGVLMQECNFEVELIIANDCSPDDTDDVIQRILKNHPNASKINYFRHEDNMGMMSNFIFSLNQCGGKYIALCEGDDFWTDPYKLQKQVDFLEQNQEFSLCFHDSFVMNDEKKLHKYVNKNETIFKTEDLFERHFIPTASIVFRNIIEFPEWFSKVKSGDKVLLFLTSLKGKFKYLDEVMSVYRIHSEGISKTHYGIKKVYDSAHLLHLIDAETNYKFNKNCQDSLLYEIETHIVPEYNIKTIKTKVLINEVLNRIIKRFKKIFK
jgi:glycosyltransferase involved in cell wall biosynthesis